MPKFNNVVSEDLTKLDILGITYEVPHLFASWVYHHVSRPEQHKTALECAAFLDAMAQVKTEWKWFWPGWVAALGTEHQVERNLQMLTLVAQGYLYRQSLEGEQNDGL